MKIIYKTGNMLDGPEPIKVHGCNSHGVMRSGIAKEIRDRHPAVFEEYRKTYEEQGWLALGQTIWVETEDGMFVNGITQKNYGRDKSVVYVDYKAISDVIDNIDRTLEEEAEVVHVAFPLIGAGLANGDWTVISGIIEDRSVYFQPIVYLFDGKFPDGFVPEGNGD